MSTIVDTVTSLIRSNEMMAPGITGSRVDPRDARHPENVSGCRRSGRRRSHARSGEVHMLLGENGAGKSTLMKILSGAYRKDSGEIRIRDQAVEITSPRHALELGIRVIYQELNLVPQLSVAENIFLGVAPTRLPGVIDRRTLTDLTRALLADLGMNLEAGTPLSRLSLAQRQMVEIAKALRDPFGFDPGDGRADIGADIARSRPTVRADPTTRRARRRRDSTSRIGSMRCIALADASRFCATAQTWRRRCCPT
jgi:hypothetical protein